MNCPDCIHLRRDEKWPKAIGYGRCMAPKGLERGAPHFASVNWARSGLCDGGKLFEAAAKEVRI